jgi:EAL domain-containing protein (putative c-di-GMP-specific phosphodiesterase class I)
VINNKLGNRAVIELIETGLCGKDRDELAIIIQKLRSHGIKIALDDVGSGDRDFSNICELPADYIKIDRVFIRGITKHKSGAAPHYAAGLNMLVKLANQLGSQVIAEGVETEMQLTGVKKAGINMAQGFYFSKPGPVEKWITDNKREVLAKC